MLEVVHIGEHGKIAIRFFEPQKTFDIIQENGVVPLPPYIKRQKTRSPGDDRDRETYQTVFAAAPGSVAAPTAGLHFSEDILLSLRQKGVRIGTVTLHVGWGTFGHLPQAPLEKIQLHKEPFILPEATAELCRQTKKEGGRIIACGTTSVRVLESAATSSGELKHGAGDTNLFIYPGYPWRLVDGILTNFHLPQSSLLMLVAAFWNWPELKNAYATAIRERYRFFSYGDAMLVL
jgi:S-adenosylmethionine:tRNA ribosyltransferase-isomerase